jgi:hypothetical protein
LVRDVFAIDRNKRHLGWCEITTCCIHIYST